VEIDFVIAVVLALSLVSVMMAARMGSQGTSAGRIALLVIEMWALFAIWMAFCWAAVGRLGAAGGPDALAEAGSFVSRLGKLEGPQRWWGVAGVVVSVAILSHLLWALRKATRATP